MAKKSMAQLHREIRKARERESAKLAKHLEIMGAAYAKATDVPPTEVALMSETLKDGTRRYWYTRFDTKPNLDECHPDIRRLFELAMEIKRAADLKNEAAVTQGVSMLCEFVKYIGKGAIDDDLKAVERAKAEAEAKQNIADNG